MKAWLWNVLVSLSQLLNAATGGDPDMTLSDRLGRAQDCRLCALLCRFLDLFDPGHCQKVRESDEQGDREVIHLGSRR